MLFAEGITIEPGWVVAGITTLAGAIAAMFKLLISSKDSQLADLKTEIANLKSINKEALTSLLGAANYYRSTYEKLPPIVPLAPVVSNSNSPSTEKQRAEADLETQKALLAAIKLAMHQEPRPEPPQAVEKGVGVPSPRALPAVSSEVKEHTKKLDEKVDEVLEKVEVVRETTADIKEVVDKATPKGRTG